MGRLSGKWAVVTGASAGIGAATARALAAEGMNLVLGARRKERLDALAAELSGVRVVPLQLDVADAAQCEAFARAAEEAGPVEVLVNNAGLARGADKLVDAAEADWREMLDTNVLALFRLTRRFVGPMIARGSGTLVQLGSIAGHEPYAGGTMYCATKAAVEVMAKALRHELLGTGVRVSTIEPGLVETEFSEVRFRGDADKAKKPYQGLVPLTAEDVAETIRFVVTRPAHVVVEELTLFPVDQASTTATFRRSVP